MNAASEETPYTATDTPAAAQPAQPQGYSLTTLREANELINALDDQTAVEENRRMVADEVLHSTTICGTPGEWHNFACAFLENGDAPYALIIARRGLERYPYATDLLADAVRAAANSGAWEEGERIIAKARTLPLKFWGWYLAVWATSFYLDKANCCDPTQRSRVISEGIDLIHACRLQFPLEERLYNQEAEALLADGRTDEARLVLESAIYHEHEANDGTPCMIPAPQCCLTYLDEILYGVNDYAKIIDIARRGMKSTASTYESANVGYFAFREALALDSSIHEEDEHNHAKGFGNQELVREALAAYKLAYKLLRNTTYRRIIRKRFDILCGKSGIDDVRLAEER